VGSDTTARTMAQSMLESPIRTPELRDELYAQLLRLASGCPDSHQQRRVWQLMAIVVSLVPPSAAMQVDSVEWSLLSHVMFS
jgi:hypothetical protein